MFSRGIQKRSKKDIEREIEEKKRVEEEKSVDFTLDPAITHAELYFHVELLPLHSPSFRKLLKVMQRRQPPWAARARREVRPEVRGRWQEDEVDSCELQVGSFRYGEE
jgi:hypothetical protein